jgi:predicted AlkP superfamily phosphohydrolase/phosphomutase
VKAFVLGLDGTTFDVLDPLAEEGVIPNIKRLCSEGAWGRLRTIFPPVTAPAWLALGTGLNPGKTGVFDYLNRRLPDDDHMVPVSSAYYEGRAIWNHLNRDGRKVIIFNYPTLSPPPAVTGFAVSGIGGYSRENLCFPASLEDELNRITGGYEVKLNLRSPIYKKNLDRLFEDVNRIMTKQAAALRFLVKQKEWDFCFAVFSFTDWMQHVLWKYIDKAHPLYDPETSQPVRRRFMDTWRRIDAVIGELVDLLPKDVNFMIVSDHGAGPVDSVFYPNIWLEKKGWLRKRNLGWKKVFVEKIKLFSEGSDNKYYNAMLHILRTRVLKIWGTMDLIDREMSLAYSPEHNTMFGCINLTERGKALDGFKERLMKELAALPESIEGINQIEVSLPEEIYSGPHVNLAPDIFFIINAYKSTIEIDFANEPFVSAPSIANRTGGHQPEGVFIAKGNGVRHARLENISVLDIVPTLLALYGIEIPADIDGRVITESIKPEVLGSLKIRRGQKASNSEPRVDEKGDLEEMKKMLKSLGYM